MRKITLLLAAMALAVVVAAPAQADSTFTVNITNDAPDASPGDGVCDSDSGAAGNQCTLRAAIEEANVDSDNDTIVIRSTLRGTIPLSVATIGGDSADGLSIKGPGADKIAVSADGADRVFDVAPDATVTISGLAISDATLTGVGNEGTLKLINSTVLNNVRGIYNRGTLNLTNSTVRNNHAPLAEGGGIYNHCLADLDLINSTVKDNTGESGGGIYNDGGSVTLTKSTVSGNTTVGSNIGISGGSGGGILNSKGCLGKLTITDSTVSGNTAQFGFGGGIYNVYPNSPPTTSPTVSLDSTTISNNKAKVGGGIRNYRSLDNYGLVQLSRTIIAGNTADSSPDADGTFRSLGDNLIGDTEGNCHITAECDWRDTDLVEVNPRLGRLQNYGGPTDTHALLPGSPAVDKVPRSLCSPRDQRGVSRVDGDRDGTVRCDIGSFERDDLTPPTVSSTAPTDGRTGVAHKTSLTATFSERMDRITLNKTTFKLFKVNADDTTTQITDVRVNSTADGLNATLNPFGTSSTQLDADSTYRAEITTGARDLAGNQLDQDSTTRGRQSMVWTFTTGSS